MTKESGYSRNLGTGFGSNIRGQHRSAALRREEIPILVLGIWVFVSPWVLLPPLPAGSAAGAMASGLVELRWIIRGISVSNWIGGD